MVSAKHYHIIRW